MTIVSLSLPKGMLAEDRSLEPFGSTTPRKLSTIGRDVKVNNSLLSTVYTLNMHITLHIATRLMKVSAPCTFLQKCN